MYCSEIQTAMADSIENFTRTGSFRDSWRGRFHNKVIAIVSLNISNGMNYGQFNVFNLVLKISVYAFIKQFRMIFMPSTFCDYFQSTIIDEVTKMYHFLRKA